MKIDRLVSIILILLEKERIGAYELAEQFEVSPRTIYRDIDAINLAGIPVRSIPGVNGGFEIMPQFKIDRKVFSTADLSAILMGLSSLSGMMRGDELANALAKVRSFIPAGQAKDIEQKANQIQIDPTPWINARDLQLYLDAIHTALDACKLIWLSYIDRSGNQTERIVEPYQLVLKSDDWYLQAYCYIREDYRMFKLTRISQLIVLDETFLPREYPAPQLDYSGAAATLQITITLRIHKSILERVLDFVSAEDITPGGEDHYIVRYPLIENDYYYGILLSFGDKCECIEPPHVRAEMKRRAEAIAALYKD